MKNYNILIVFILISILSGCGGKNYLGEKVVVSTTNLRLIEDNNSFLEQIGQIIDKLSHNNHIEAISDYLFLKRAGCL